MSIEKVSNFRRKIEKNVAKNNFAEASQDIRAAVKYLRKHQIHCSICDKATTKGDEAHDFPNVCSCKRSSSQETLAKEMTCFIYNQGRCDIQTATTADDHLAVANLFAMQLVPWISAIKSAKTKQKRWIFASRFLWQRIVCKSLTQAPKKVEFAEVSLLAAELALSWEMRGENFKMDSNVGRTGRLLQQLHRVILSTKSSSSNVDKFVPRMWRLYNLGVQRCVELMTYQHGSQAKNCCPVVKPLSFGDDKLQWAPIKFECAICQGTHEFSDMWKLVRQCMNILITAGTHYVLQLQQSPKNVSATVIDHVMRIGKESSRLARTFIQGK